MHINRKAVTWNLKAVSMVWKCARTAVQEPALMSVLVVLFFGFAAVQPAIPYDDEPDTVIDRNVPFEMWAPWYNSDNTEVEDEVLLRGQMHVVIQVWLSGEDHIDRVTFHVNAVGVNGTSETTGQRFRLTGGYTKDLQDPDITLNPDGTIDLPFLEGDLQISKVDPEPARLTQVLSAGGTASGIYVYNPPPPLVTCVRVYAPDGTETAYVDCGSFKTAIFLAPGSYAYRVLTNEGDACVPGTTCVVPDGATLFNGYEGDYKTPLLLSASTYYPTAPVGSNYFRAVSVLWTCKTGDRLAPVQYGGAYPTCVPFYSATDPISVKANIVYETYRYVQGSLQTYQLLVSDPPYTFHMLERPADQAPEIDSFSVQATAGPAQWCIIGERCEVPNGALLYNGEVGDYYPPLYMQLTASDFEGDPMTVNWYCQTGGSFAPVSDLGGGLFSCDPIRSYSEDILVYATVSDGTNTVTSEIRTMHMANRPPVIDTFSVQAEAGPAQWCILGQHCEVPNGALLFNGEIGDYYPPLYLQLTASDPDSDPVSVEWFCQSGTVFAPVTDLGGGMYSCNPVYTFPGPILVYAKVSDGVNEVTSETRTLYMAEIIR